MTLFGDTPADRARSLRLLAALALVWPFILVAEVSRLLGVPCRD